MPSAFGGRVRAAAGYRNAAQCCAGIAAAGDARLIVGAVVINATEKGANGVTRWVRRVLVDGVKCGVTGRREVIFRRDGGLDRHGIGGPATGLGCAAFGAQILEVAGAGARRDRIDTVAIGKAHVERAADLPCALTCDIIGRADNRHIGEGCRSVTSTLGSLIIRCVAVGAAQQTREGLASAWRLILGRGGDGLRSAGGGGSVVDWSDFDIRFADTGLDTANAGAAPVVNGHRYRIIEARPVGMVIPGRRIDQTVKRGVDLPFGAYDGQRACSII